VHVNVVAIGAIATKNLIGDALSVAAGLRTRSTEAGLLAATQSIVQFANAPGTTAGSHVASWLTIPPCVMTAHFPGGIVTS
jgi:hypothetical protein